MVEIKRIPIQTVELFTPNNESLGFINNVEYNDVVLQICKQNIDGYYIVFDGKKINIDSDGQLDRWPCGLFDIQLSQFRDLIESRKVKRKENNQYGEN